MTEGAMPRRRWRRGLLVLLLGCLGWTLVVCYPNPVVLFRNFARYRCLPLDPEIAWSMQWSIPKDPARIEQFVDALLTPAADWETYRVPWYMPAAWEVAEELQGDCESKAVLLASLLAGRHLPFEVRASFSHIWVDYPGRSERPGEKRSLAYLEGKEGRLRIRRPSALELTETLRIQKEILWDAMPPFRKQAWLVGTAWVLLAALTTTARLPQLTVSSQCRQPARLYLVWAAAAITGALMVISLLVMQALGPSANWSAVAAYEALAAGVVTGAFVTWLWWGCLRRRLAGVRLEDNAVVVYTQRGPLRRARRVAAADLDHLQLRASRAGQGPWLVSAVLHTGKATPLLCYRSEVAARRALRQLGLRLDRPIVIRTAGAEIEIGPEQIGLSLAARARNAARPEPPMRPKTLDVVVTRDGGVWRLGYPQAGRAVRWMLLAIVLLPAAFCVFTTWLVGLFPRSLLLWAGWTLAAAFLTTICYLVIVLREEMVARLGGATVEVGDGELRLRGADGATVRVDLAEIETLEPARHGHSEVLAIVCFDRVLRIGGFGGSAEVEWVREVLTEAIAGGGALTPAGAAPAGSGPPDFGASTSA